jgi:hypothetical protein
MGGISTENSGIKQLEALLNKLIDIALKEYIKTGVSGIILL